MTAIRLARVVDPHQPPRASGVPRMLGVLVLLAGIAAMHAGIFPIGPGDHHVAMTAQPDRHGAQPLPPADRHGATTAARAEGALPAAEHVLRAAGIGCDGCDSGHAGLHGCVFILTALALAFLLVLLYRVAVDRPGGGVSKPRHWRPRRARPPPWTVLSLAELSILRI
ncbi:DUF6153 family protein [Nocardia sp. NPDC050710]|uniref:DUF6153 family protein n=1 Tax=Nocardia sp. NPDC050710 TaxID=3157220 RepID=UPI0033DE093C